MNLEPPARNATFHDPPIDPPGFFGEPAELVDAEAPFAARLRNRLAGFQGDHLRRLVAAALHLVGNGVQGVSTVEGGLGLPCRKARRSRVDGGFGICNSSDRGLAQGSFGDRAEYRGSSPARRPDPNAPDEQSEPAIHLSTPRLCGSHGPRPWTSSQPRPEPTPDVHPQTPPRGSCLFQWHRQRRRSRHQTPRGSVR